MKFFFAKVLIFSNELFQGTSETSYLCKTCFSQQQSLRRQQQQQQLKQQEGRADSRTRTQVIK
jgi:hypothetical protein